MTPNTVILSNSSYVGSSPAGLSGVGGGLMQWQGGRTMFSMTATTYASGAVYLQGLLPDGASFYSVGGPYGTDQLTSLDLPRGQFKLVNQSGVSTGVNAALSSVQYF